MVTTPCPNAATPTSSHHVRINYGKHAGELFTRLPVSYLRWMINENVPMADIARIEFDRRGDTMPKVELSGHAINNASLRVRKIWHETRSDDEGIYSWLQRMTLEAMEHGRDFGDDERFAYKGMIFVIAQGAEYPALKTIMVDKKTRKPGDIL